VGAFLLRDVSLMVAESALIGAYEYGFSPGPLSKNLQEPLTHEASQYSGLDMAHIPY
jgi:hypothetical protein